MATSSIPPAPKPVIDETGLTLPLFPDVHEWLKSAFREIYGQDIYIENDSQDGQLIGVLAKAMHDAYSSVGAAYNAFSPTTAQGEGLSRVTKINGIRRKIPTRSSVDLRIVGWAGTIITGGIALGATSNRWLLPDVVVIPPESEIIVTATSELFGDVFAPPNSITRIGKTTRGWQSVTNPEASTVGSPLENDAALRVRQSISTAIPSLSTFESLVGAVASVDGIDRYRGYENETTGIDDYGFPQNSIAIVVEGGDAQEIATVIFKKKAPGTITYGTTFETVIDSYGIPHKINFSRPVQVPVQVMLFLKPLPRYTVSKELAVRTAVASFINAHPIGDVLSVEEIGAPAMLASPEFPLGDPTFRILPGIKISRFPPDLQHDDLIPTYYERFTCTTEDVVVINNEIMPP